MKTIRTCAALAYAAGLAALAGAEAPSRAQVIDLRTKSNPVGSMIRLPGGSQRGGVPGRVSGLESEAPAEFIEFTLVKSQIDAGDLGGPGYVGTWRPPAKDVAQIELRSTVGVGVKYESSSGLTNERSGRSLETFWETSVRGVWRYPGGPFKQTGYNEFMATDPGRDAIEFAGSPDPSYIKGFQARVAVTRGGLNDGAGTYRGSLTMSWYKF